MFCFVEKFKEEMKNLRPLFVEEDLKLGKIFKSQKGKGSVDDDLDITKLEID